MNTEKASADKEYGFTLMEVLVVTGMMGLLMSMIVIHVLSVQSNYRVDLIRTQINSNLRSAMDIISMNIRQAGENLSSSFPAVLVKNGDSNKSDSLTLRRSLASEVLTLCSDAGSGATNLDVSVSSLGNSECVASNVASSYAVFNSWLTERGGEMPVYLFDNSTSQGEFVTMNGGGISGNEYYLTVSGTEGDYPAISTNIYLLEEYKFSLNVSDSTLEVFLDGDEDTPRAVAFAVTSMDIELELNSDATVYSLSASDSYDWKQLKQIHVSLTGEDRYKKDKVNSTISSEYFPRNVLSIDG